MRSAAPPVWLVQSNMPDSRFREQLAAELDALGERWLGVHVVSGVNELPLLPFDSRTRPVVCMGPSFVPRVASAGWTPGIFFDVAAFRWSAMRAQWQELMFSDGRVATARDALAELLEGAVPLFVRPDADSKAFDGGVFAGADAFRAALGAVDLATPVAIAPPRAVDAEWRCFVVGRDVVDASEYRRAGRPSIHRGAPQRAIELVERAIERWLPAPVTCIDVASSGDRFGIVEANCFNASRFYAADIRTVLAAVAAHVREHGSTDS